MSPKSCFQNSMSPNPYACNPTSLQPLDLCSNWPWILAFDNIVFYLYIYLYNNLQRRKKEKKKNEVSLNIIVYSI